MKKMKLLCVLCIITFFACDKNKDGLSCSMSEDNYIIFGTYYGECGGNCAFLFKIENCGLFEDDMETFYNELISFLPEVLSEQEYEIAKVVFTDFPSLLWSETESEFGIPDAYDQGGIYIEKFQNGEKKSWRLDTNEDALPEYLAEYAAEVKAVVIDLTF